MRTVQCSSFARLLSLALALTLASTAAAVTYVVDDDGVQCPAPDFSDIQAAVDASGPTDIVDVCPGTYSAFDVIGHDDLIVRSTDGPGSTFVEGFDNGCYGIFIRDVDGLTIEGFDISPMFPFDNGCDASAIATAFAGTQSNVVIRNNVIHDIKPAGSSSCSGSYGIIGMALNNVHDILVEGNRFHSMNNEGCVPGTSAEVAGGTANIKSFSAALQVIFASGANSCCGPDLIEIRDNVIEDGRAFNPVGIRVKRAANFVVTGNRIFGLTNTDGTMDYPSTSVGFNAQGALDATIRGDVMGNDVDLDVGFVLEAASHLRVTENDFGGTVDTGFVVANSTDNFICDNILGQNGIVADGTSVFNSFPGGSAFPGNMECPDACCEPCTLRQLLAPFLPKEPSTPRSDDPCAGLPPIEEPPPATCCAQVEALLPGLGDPSLPTTHPCFVPMP